MPRNSDNSVKRAERQRCEFFVLRYVPDAVKDEFVNVGVVVLASDGHWADVRFTRDWKRVRCLDPDVDVEMLQGLEHEIHERLHEGGDTREWLLHRMQETFSNAIQLTASRALLAESPQEELGRLAEMYLESRSRGVRVVSGRQQIVAAMRAEFERNGVWSLMQKNIAVHRYVNNGDPLKIDCGYSVAEFGGEPRIRLYHAVSLDSDVNSAKVLAFSYPRLREAIEKRERLDSTLTAIVESELDRSNEATAFALDTLASSGVNVASVADLPRISENIRREMRIT